MGSACKLKLLKITPVLAWEWIPECVLGQQSRPTAGMLKVCEFRWENWEIGKFHSILFFMQVHPGAGLLLFCCSECVAQKHTVILLLVGEIKNSYSLFHQQCLCSNTGNFLGWDVWMCQDADIPSLWQGCSPACSIEQIQCQSSIYLPINLFVCLFVCLSVCLSIICNLPINLFIC